MGNAPVLTNLELVEVKSETVSEHTFGGIDAK
jgi:hypothetical protein